MNTFPNVKLLPCLHCGSKDVTLRRNISANDNGDMTVYWWVECCDCGIRTSAYEEDCGSMISPDTVFDAINDAVSCSVDTWNHRVDNANTHDKYGRFNRFAHDAHDIDLDTLSPDELSSLGKRITDTLVDKACTILNEIDKELNKHD